jgi:hypothetical protein
MHAPLPITEAVTRLKAMFLGRDHSSRWARRRVFPGSKQHDANPSSMRSSVPDFSSADATAALDARLNDRCRTDGRGVKDFNKRGVMMARQKTPGSVVSAADRAPKPLVAITRGNEWSGSFLTQAASLEAGMDVLGGPRPQGGIDRRQRVNFTAAQLVPLVAEACERLKGVLPKAGSAVFIRQ